jgi:putative CocE/NonD family hydrolase
MEKTHWKVIVPVLAAILLLSGWIFINQRKAEKPMISTFGKYQGYSEPVYDGTQRTSDYLTLSDGTRLAYDLIIPTKKGVLADKPLPVLFKYTPYGRTWTIFDKKGGFLLQNFAFLDWPSKAMLRVRYILMGDKGRFMDPLFRDRWLENVVNHGYIVVSVDRPGTGASFSSPTPGSMETAAKFENEIMNWIAVQSWSDGNIGMYGDSQQAMVQLAAASAGNPHLKAILPAASHIDIYQAVEYPGGVFNKAFAALYASTVPYLDRLATPVDGDPDGVLLAQARASRQNTVSIQNASEVAAQYPYNDSTNPDGINLWQTMDLYPLIDRINNTHTAIYMTVGWYDLFTADMFYWYANLNVPKHLTVRPTDHSQVSANLPDLDYGTEALRWVDYWLKGIDNGIMDEAPIHYYLQDGPKKGTWQTSDQWPLAAQKVTRFYFSQGKTGSVASVNDGNLITSPPIAATASDAYRVDYTTTTGTKTRWGAVEEAHYYPDLRTHDAKALTYTTQALETSVEVTGHPVVHLWLSTGAPDLDAFVYLEEIDSSGHSTYITEGDLRVSHRKLVQAPFNNLGLPYQSHNQSDLVTVPGGEPFELVFSLLPTSYQFHPGSRMRITVAFTDAGNFDTPILDPAPTVQLLRDVSHPSSVELPIIKHP